MQVLVHDGRGGRGVKGHAAGDHVVEGGAQGIEVGAGIDIQFAADLFRGDVVGRAIGLAGLGLGGFDIGGFAGQAHVGELGVAVLGDHDVLGFDVAVDEAGLVGVGQGLAGLDDELEGFLLGVAFALFELVVDGLAFHVFHDEIVEAVGLADVHRTDDVGVVELGGGLSFLVEAVDEFLVLAHALGEDLDGHDAVQGNLAGLEDRGHRAGAQLGKNLVAGNLLHLPLFFHLGADAFDLERVM